jgi:hypothetical protein
MIATAQPIATYFFASAMRLPELTLFAARVPQADDEKEPWFFSRM